MSDWHIYRKDAGKPHNDIVAAGRLPPPPSWRDFKARQARQTRGQNYKASDSEVEMVNAALYLRRPLLITGTPGSGKSSLAYSVAWQLNLGPVLWWPINSRSTLQEGLYNYDALGRLRDLNIEKIEADRAQGNGPEKKPSRKRPKKMRSAAERIGRYIRLGPLGTALYGGPKPRVLLIDEVDKSDIDLPNDLLHVLEEGAFDIPELQRLTPDEGDDGEPFDRTDEGDRPITVNVFPHAVNRRSSMIPIKDGRVECKSFPLIILTSNGERDLPPAFRRRCLSLDIKDPDGNRLRDIVAVHIKEAIKAGAGKKSKEALELLKDVSAEVAQFVERRDKQKQLLATDQLLNAIYLITRDKAATGEERNRILQVVLRELGRR